MSFIQAFLQQTVYMGMPDDSALPREGTVTPAVNFSASGDAAVLDKAIKAKGVDENTIIEILVKRSNEQRQRIKDAYQQASGKPLDVALKSALSGDLEDMVLALLKTPAHYDAQQLKAAMKGLGTDEEVLIEILASRTNREILDIKKAYKEDYKKDLESDIKSDTGGDFRTALLELCKTLSPLTCGPLIAVFERYSKYSKVDVSKAIDLEMKGDIESCLTAVVKCAGSRPAFFAEKLYLSMKGKGTRKHTLTRIMVSRSEVDLKRIKDEYKKAYGKTLYQDILDRTAEELRRFSWLSAELKTKQPITGLQEITWLRQLRIQLWRCSHLELEEQLIPVQLLTSVNTSNHVPIIFL
ncbi:hypothetical protein PFLUV_G00077070 [Perca fluviatilis]|uniref:Annexin n=1 Tax=Perca fluviatilis TaxID=8168 RepID=A0A6A5FBT0_PERFL|nr:hypothetical protein PFLUV_G00077070 [Perca fluviatilis]